MRLGAYSVNDKAVNAFLPPFFCRTDAEATRSFSQACNDPQHDFNKHASYYTLFALGEFDDENGVLTSNVRVLVHASSLVSSA
ncbi:nonstructural protein [robinz microvirus RP_105]|nr:nonstructural protein [robinz microvirus RP_105]